jgi:hypothetical protein
MTADTVGDSLLLQLVCEVGGWSCGECWWGGDDAARGEHGRCLAPPKS